MLVEFTGCTGTGKTTLSERVIERLLEKGVDTVAVNYNKLSLDGKTYKRIKHKTAYNAFMDVKALMWIVFSFRNNLELLKLSYDILQNYADSRLTAINLYRNICRRIGSYRYFRSEKFQDRLILVDEGSVHTIHNLFVHHNSVPGSEYLRRFSEIVPLPDLIVYVQSPLDVILERTVSRRDQPRRIEHSNVVKYIEKAHRVFEEFTAIDRIKKKIVTVNYYENGVALADRLAEYVSEYIIQRMGRIN
jgi:thymidylate kinase